jgi:hypothetical protein
MPTENRQTRFFYILFSNLALAYGVLFQGWHFFPILFLFWFEELIVAVFDTFRMRRIRQFLSKNQPENDAINQISLVMRYIFLAVWLIFVLTFGGIFMEKEGAFGAYLDTIFFKNQLFNFNLLYFFGSEMIIFLHRFSGKNEPNATESEIKNWAAPIHTRGILIHVGIIFGGFAGMFFGAKYFAFAFLILKIMMDFGIFFQKTFNKFFSKNEIS